MKRKGKTKIITCSALPGIKIKKESLVMTLSYCSENFFALEMVRNGFLSLMAVFKDLDRNGFYIMDHWMFDGFFNGFGSF